MTIYKYEFNISRKVTFYTRKVYEILHFDSQRPGSGTLCMWAIVNPDTDPGHDTQEFYVIGTGGIMPINKDLKHLATVMDGEFVWHIFREAEPVKRRLSWPDWPPFRSHRTGRVRW